MPYVRLLQLPMAAYRPLVCASLATSLALLTMGCGQENRAITSSSSKFEVDDGPSTPPTGGNGDSPSAAAPSENSLVDARPATPPPSSGSLPISTPSPAPSASGPARAPDGVSSTRPSGAAPAQPPSIPRTELDDFAVPDGTPEELWQYIEDLARRQPQGRTEQDFFRNLQEIMGAQITAAEKILEHPDATREMRQRGVEVKLSTLQELMRFGVPEAQQHFEEFGRALVNDEDQELARFGRMLTFALDVSEVLEGDGGDTGEIVAKAEKLLQDEERDNETFQYVRSAAIELLQSGHVDHGQQIVEMLLEAFDGVTDGELPQQVAILPEESYFLRLEVPQKLTAFVQQEPDALEPLQKATRQLLGQARPGVTTLQQALFVADAMERTNEIAAAEEVFSRIGEVFADAEDENAANLAKEATESAAIRLGMVGSPLSLSGRLRDGTELNWDELREGKVVLVTFWSMENLRHLQQELPRIKELLDLYDERGFRVVGINVDEEPQDIEQFFRFQSFPWPNIMDGTVGGGQLVKQCGVATIPFNILINREGHVVALHVSAETLPDKLLELLN